MVAKVVAINLKQYAKYIEIMGVTGQKYLGFCYGHRRIIGSLVRGCCCYSWELHEQSGGR